MIETTEGCHYIIPLFIPNMGCARRCLFCDQHVTGGSGMAMPPSSVADTIERYLGTMHAENAYIEAAFYGGSFTALPTDIQESYLAEAWRYVRKGALRSLRVSTRPDCINPGTVGMLRRYGVEVVELGVQSFSDRVLDACGRGHTAADSAGAIALLRNEGMRIIVQLMTGLPLDTPGISAESARIAAECGPDGVRLFPTVVLRGTGLAALYEAGEYSPLSMEEAIERCKAMYIILTASSVPVIRMGLHPLRPVERDSILAGPYHPAFGFLVKSRLRRDSMERALAEHIAGNRSSSPLCLELTVPAENREEYFGLKRENIYFLEKRFPPHRIRIAKGSGGGLNIIERRQ